MGCSEWIAEAFDWGQYAKPILLWCVVLFLRLVQGLGVFRMIVLLYHTPFMLLVRSTFHDDEPLTIEWSWSLAKKPVATVSRLVQLVFYYSHIISLSSVRRFFYIATHPFSWNPWRLFNLGPERIYKKIQIYFEAELFMPSADGKETRKEFGDRVANVYKTNLRLLDGGEKPFAECATCFEVLGKKNLEKIQKYFTAQIKVHRDPKFLTRIKFESGYLAPAYLVSGLLSEYDEDWTKIVNAYPDKMKRLNTIDDRLSALPGLRRLQSFIWDCWVQWGPSVPVCNSSDWKSGELALQFGYGDENNSMPLRCKGQQGAGERRGYRFEDWERKVREIREGLKEEIPYGEGWAWPVKVEGNLRWLVRGDRNSKFCVAQHDTKTWYDNEGWMVFDADTEAIKAKLGEPLFFSAYVWVLIAICRSTDPLPDDNQEDSAENAKHVHRQYRLVERKKEDEWRCLIPFFQHGNIAEPSVYEAIKEELASKTVECLLGELKKAELAKVDWLHFAFVAAYDDNGDAGHSKNVATSASESSSIRELMLNKLKARIAHEGDTETKSELESYKKRMHLEPDALKELTACRLPHVVRAYLDHVEVISKAAEKSGK